MRNFLIHSLRKSNFLLLGKYRPMTRTVHLKFRRIRYRPTVTACLFLILVLCGLSAAPNLALSGLKNPPILQPVNTSSPRATLRSFLVNANQAYKEFQSAGYRSKAAMKHIFRATKTLDLSRIPKTLREDVNVESVMRLKEIFDHIEITTVDTVPRAEDFNDKETRSWRIPQTDITIARVNEGPREGAWLFTAETVSQIEDYYKLLEEIRGADKPKARAYEQYIYSPGWMISVKFIKALPTWMQTGIFEQALWQWISLLLVFAVGIIALLWTWRAASWLQHKIASPSRCYQWIDHLHGSPFPAG
jgi:MscS family membrane protein